MSACAHNYVLINVSICFAETFRENLSAKFRRKFRRNFGENYTKFRRKSRPLGERRTKGENDFPSFAKTLSLDVSL